MEEKKKNLLSQGLHQIIQTDQRAAAIIQGARDKSAQMEKDTKTERAQILADAEARYESVSREVEQEETHRYEALEQKAKDEAEAKKQQLQAQFSARQDIWVEEIVGRITGKA